MVRKMGNKKFNEVLSFAAYLNLGVEEFRQRDKEYVAEVGLESVDRHFKSALTRFNKQLLECVLACEEHVKHNRGFKFNNKKIGQYMEKVIRRLDREMVYNTKNAENLEETADLDDICRGLPDHFRVFITSVIVSTDLFMLSYLDEISDDKIKAEYKKLSKRNRTLKEQLVKLGIIWFNKEEK